ncbi:MAG TPA: type IV pilin protein [Solimonas sp.]|nr:type IV pilin protein [Solimonas sp.]
MHRNTKGGGPAARRVAGFTLVELMFAIAIVGILSAIAFPAYRQYVIRGYRSGAKAQMMDIANREQQFLIANRTYATKAQLTANGFVLEPNVANKYTWDVALGVAGMPTFTVTFTPIGGQATDGPLTLDSQGNKTPADKWKK